MGLKNDDQRTQEIADEHQKDLLKEYRKPVSKEPEIPSYNVPDGGWGWAVCFACFLTHVLIDGICYSFGIVFPELLDYYKGTKAETSWIISLSTSVCFLSGPFVAPLANRFGCRLVAFVGTLITSASLVISVYAPNLYFLYFSFGIMMGIGYGMTYLPTIVCVSQYFEKRRAFATGLGVCGTGVGTFIFSPLTALLVETYAWRGAILIQAGLMLNCLACSLIYRPLELIKKVKEKEGNDTLDEQYLCLKSAENDCIVIGTKNAENNDINKQQDCAFQLKDTQDSNGSNIVENKCSVKYRSAKKGGQNVSTNIESKDSKNGFMDEMIASLKESFSLELFRMKAFSLFVISTFFYSIGYYIPYVYLPVRARDAGIDEIRAAWLLSTIGITNTIGRVVFGYLSDRRWVNRLYLYNTALVICGIGTALGPVLSSFPSLLLYSVVFGTFSGVTISLTSVLITDIVGIANLSRGFGVTNFAAGIAILVGPPLGGWIKDVTGSYNGSFLLAGVTIAFSGAMLYVIPCVDKNWNQNKKTRL